MRSTLVGFARGAAAEFYDPAWGRAYADFDPERAMELLEEMGMRDRDGDGWREAPGGEQFVIDMNVRTDSVLGTMGFSTSELVRDFWQEVGVKVSYKQISDELNSQLRGANKLDLVTWVAGGLSVDQAGADEPIWDRLVRLCGALE